MEVSERIDGAHATPSPCGCFVAYIIPNAVRISQIQELRRCEDFAVRVPNKEVTALKWSDGSSALAVCSAKLIEIVLPGHSSRRVRLGNGSGGLGRFVSADFVGEEQLLTIWEFGKAKLWDLATGRGVEVGEVKTTCEGRTWQLRPAPVSGAVEALAILSRPAAEDVLTIYFPTQIKSLPPIKLPTTDAQALSWSPDGRWLAILDTPTAAPSSVHFFTPDGHLFRSYPPASSKETTHFLGIKSITWSLDSTTVALGTHEGRIVLLSTRTFSHLALIEHISLISQTALSASARAPIWRETVSAYHARSFALASQPFSPPLTRTIKPSSPEHFELGTAEIRFSATAAFLATRDERMQSTVWLWDLATLAAHAVLVLHANVRRMCWHPEKEGVLMLECGEGVVYFFDAGRRDAAPEMVEVGLLAGMVAWVGGAEGKGAVFVTTRAGFRVVYPEGRDVTDSRGLSPVGGSSVLEYAEGESEDSLMEMLSGRKPMHKHSYTEEVDVQVGAEDEQDRSGGVLEDTFREKRRVHEEEEERDPFDDSQIF